MSKNKVIENPEVPGLEQSFPPLPPPPPPPPIINKLVEAGNDISNVFLPLPPMINKTEENVLQSLPPPPPPIITKPVEAVNDVISNVFPPPPPIRPDEAVNDVIPHAFSSIVAAPLPVPMPNPLINPMFMAGATPHQLPPGQPVAWWVPTEADTSDMYSQWVDHGQNTPIFIPQAPAEAKVKQNKRKVELINPAEDAERVANAQRELTALMKPLKCDLCNAVMNSTLQAKLHYDGKPHQKKVSMFLNQSVKKLKSDDGQITSGTATDWCTYCEVCKTWFTSQTDAAQHYAGKKHIRATTGQPRSNSSKKNTNSTPVDPLGRYGIGTAFQIENQPVFPDVNPITTPILHDPAVVAPTPLTYGAALRCDLCGVSANRLEQLETHKRGARHQKMLRARGLTTSEIIIPSAENVIISASIDYSIYRTPSGSYYCGPCNKSFTSENSFAQHVESKKHKNQIGPKSSSIHSSLLTKKEKEKKKIL